MNYVTSATLIYSVRADRSVRRVNGKGLVTHMARLR